MAVPIEAWPVPSVVQAPLNYLVQADEKPVVYTATPGATASERSGTFEWQTVSIADGRPVVDRLSLDGAGFELRPHDTAVSSFYDDEEVRTIYYPEVEQLVKAATGASRVVIFDHTVRIEDAAQRNEKAVRAPVRVVHNDYTVRSGRQRVRDLLEADDAETFLQHRFAVVNVWRSIGAPVETTPLAIADAQSVAPADFVATDLVYPDRTGEIYQVAYSPNHRWFYFPKMRRDEALLLKCYDSATDGRARFTAHTAFDDPTAPDDAPPRESIEVRTLISYAP
ncbi:MAG: CmcJ/NvfI family oxidoreductase [Acidiferrobacterales bacterium]